MAGSARWELRAKRSKRPLQVTPYEMVQAWMQWYGLERSFFSAAEMDDLLAAGKEVAHYVNNVNVTKHNIVILFDYEIEKVWGE